MRAVADFWYPPKDFIKRVSLRITNEVDGVSRVVYDLTSKPPGKYSPFARLASGVHQYLLLILEQGLSKWSKAIGAETEATSYIHK